MSKLGIAILWLLSIFLTVLTVVKCSEASMSDDYESVRLENAELLKSRDSLGREVAKFRVMVLDEKALSLSKDSIIDSLRRTSDNWKSLYMYVVADIETQDSIEASVRDTTITRDSVVYKAGVFDWGDKWLTLQGTYLFDEGTIGIKYSLRNRLSFTYEWKRDRLFARPVMYGTVINENPNTSVGRVTTFVVRSPDQRFYEKWWFQLCTGFVLGGVSGYLIGK